MNQCTACRLYLDNIRRCIISGNKFNLCNACADDIREQLDEQDCDLYQSQNIPDGK